MAMDRIPDPSVDRPRLPLQHFLAEPDEQEHRRGGNREPHRQGGADQRRGACFDGGSLGRRGRIHARNEPGAVVGRNPFAYNPEDSTPEDRMLELIPALRDRRGITVLALVLLIILVIAVAVLVSRYLAV